MLELGLYAHFEHCISFHDNNSLLTMLENIKINLTHGSNDLFRLHPGKTLTQTFNFEGPFYVSSGCIPALNGSKKS